MCTQLMIDHFLQIIMRFLYLQVTFMDNVSGVPSMRICAPNTWYVNEIPGMFSEILSCVRKRCHMCTQLMTDNLLQIITRFLYLPMLLFYFFIYYVIFIQEYPISAQHCPPWGSCITCMTKQAPINWISIHSVIIQWLQWLLVVRGTYIITRHYMHNVNYLYMFLITVVTCFLWITWAESLAWGYVHQRPGMWSKDLVRSWKTWDVLGNPILC